MGELDEAVVYFVHTVAISKRIDLGRAAKRFLDSEFVTSAAWPSDEMARLPLSLAKVERSMARLNRNKAWTEKLTGFWSFVAGVFTHPVIAFRVLRMVQSSRNAISTGVVEDTASFDTTMSEIKNMLLNVQKVTLVEKDIDAHLFWSEREDIDAYIRFFLRETRHTIQIGDKERTVTLEPRVLLHREGVMQIVIGVHFPRGCTPAEVIDASFPAAPVFRTSRIPEPYAAPGAKWVGGDWAEEREGGVRIRVLEHEQPSSVTDWLDTVVGRVLHDIEGFESGPSYTYPVIMVGPGTCCAEWAENHAQDIARMSIRKVPNVGDQITLSAGPNLSAHTGMRIYATAGSALIVHLRKWRVGILDLHHTLIYERIGLVYIRLRSLEQRIADFRTGKREVLRTYRTALELEKEARGAYYRFGSARNISRHVLNDLGGPEILDVVRSGTSMLGERASTRASAQVAKASNRIALFGVVVAVIAAIPAIQPILKLIEQQRAADPETSIWAVLQTLVTSPILFSALVLGAVILYGVSVIGVLLYRVIRYLMLLRKRGYLSRIEGYEITIDDPVDN
ncbi:hypothetical protein [Lysinibacter cavernae]|uniref:Uncharacterized protein n=1 Tax=Lysinibacter cavernae TaxID=1640652 RepID=A0A7X5R3K9_9MICO|nr:hypothetical protein [Lysinibacter cavernae]NIH55018.1 hypothetical protein [Lysinibacter cavernae]